MWLYCEEWAEQSSFQMQWITTQLTSNAYIVKFEFHNPTVWFFLEELWVFVRITWEHAEYYCIYSEFTEGKLLQINPYLHCSSPTLGSRWNHKKKQFKQNSPIFITIRKIFDVFKESTFVMNCPEYFAHFYLRWDSNCCSSN